MEQRSESVMEKLKVAAAQRHTNLDGFVHELQNAMAEFRIPLSDRSFRQRFSRNYRILFQANPNGYRVEVLETVLDLTAEISVNRRLHHITGLAIRKGYLLQQRLSQLFSLLEASEVKRHELRQLLWDLDQAWMEFEKHYIMDLIDIEAEARQPLADAVNLELQLRQAEEQVASRDDEEVPPLGHGKHPWSPSWAHTAEEQDACSSDEASGVAASMPSISTVSQWIAGRTSSQSESSLDIQQLAVSASADGDVERREKMKELLKQADVKATTSEARSGRRKGHNFRSSQRLKGRAEFRMAQGSSGVSNGMSFSENFGTWSRTSPGSNWWTTP